MVLKSQQYDDVYFSAQDGFAETHYVFLDGNTLTERFKALSAGDVFTIGETGFGTGLNFFAVWALFNAYAPENARLCFASLEKFPLAPDVIDDALQPWSSQIGAQLDAFLTVYRETPRDDFSCSFDQGRVSLGIGIGDAPDCLARAQGGVNAWFLDGFKPSSNPDMWTQEIFDHVARLSAPDATLASFTAAGFVRRGLAQAGFDMSKRAGFGRKRDMIVGRLRSEGDVSCA